MQVALSRACIMMKQYFINISICMQQEVAGIYKREMQILTCNLFLGKIEISYFTFYFILNLYFFGEPRTAVFSKLDYLIKKL